MAESVPPTAIARMKNEGLPLLSGLETKFGARDPNPVQTTPLESPFYTPIKSYLRRKFIIWKIKILQRQY